MDVDGVRVHRIYIFNATIVLRSAQRWVLLPFGFDPRIRISQACHKQLNVNVGNKPCRIEALVQLLHALILLFAILAILNRHFIHNFNGNPLLHTPPFLIRHTLLQLLPLVPHIHHRVKAWVEFSHNYKKYPTYKRIYTSICNMWTIVQSTYHLAAFMLSLQVAFPNTQNPYFPILHLTPPHPWFAGCEMSDRIRPTATSSLLDTW